MKLVWKLSIPQMCIVVCVGLISYAVVTSSLNSLRAQYVSDVIENRFRRVVRDITASELEAVKLTSLFTDMPLVIQAYETALSGDIDDANSPQAQAARELLRKELAPMLDSYEKETGNKLKLHFHLPNARSLVRLWRDKNVHINGESLDISDDLSEYRHTVLDVLKSGKAVMGIELGSGGFAIRGVVPVKAPDGRLLGSAEVLQDFQPVLDDVMADGKIELILYLNEDRVSLAANGNRSDANSSNLLELRKNPQKGNFFRITEPRDEISDSFITPELLSKENNGQFVERRGSIVLATLPINDYQDTQLGVLVCVINTAHVTRLVDTATIVLTLMLMLMVIAPSLSLLLGLRVLVINPLNRIKAKIRDIAEDRADLSEQIQSCQKDEIGALARWFNVLTAKVNTMLDQMREADERTQIMLDATPMVATILDKNLNRLDCSQEALKLFAVPSKQEFLERFFDFSPEYQPCGELSIEKVRKLFGKAFEEGYARTEWMLQTLGGEPIPSEVTLVRVKYRDDYIVAGYVHDLRERKAAMAQLAAESARFEAMAHWYGSILDAIPFPISVQDSDAKWTFVNAANEKLLGKSRKNILGQYCSSWGVSICNTEKCAIACAKRGEVQTRFCHDGASYQVDVAALKDLHGETAGYIEIIQDVTQMERMAEEAVAANRAKSAFLATMSHEIRTPINAILGIAEIQLQNKTPLSSKRESFERIFTAGYTLLGIINDILDLSKIEAGKLELMPAPYEIGSLISDTLHLNLVRIGSKQIDFTLQLDENIPLDLFGDELRIKQILNNLLSNAFKYTEKGEVRLSVGAEYRDGEAESDVILVCRVSDTGSGMTEDQVETLFDEYSRFNMEANRLIEGTGLGMNITQHLIKMMNGVIYVESKPGVGSTFTVRLPQGNLGSGMLTKELAENLRRFSGGSSRLMMPQVLHKPMPYGSVLIVDDVETNLYVSKGLMMPYGLKIDTAMSGFEAIERIKQGKEYDVIFMDHMMPKMDGIETTKIIRSLGYSSPIVAFTANAVLGQAEVFLDNGFDDYISKPIDTRQLDAMLNRLVRSKHIEEASEEQVDGSGISQIYDEKETELLTIFVRDVEKSLAVLEPICEAMQGKQDIDENSVISYVVNVHAMKSALANVGEERLSALAFELEQAGRKRDFAVMYEKTSKLLDGLRQVIRKVAPKEDSQVADDDSEPEFLRKKLYLIQVSCEAYNKKVAKDALAELKQKSWSYSTKKLLNSLAGFLLYGDFDKAAASVKEAITKEGS